MKSFPSFVAMATVLATVADAHSVFTTLFVNDVSQGDGTCVRMNMDPQHCSSPIAGLESEDMACGASGSKPVAFTCLATAGAKLTFEWRMWADGSQPGAIDISHKGPCAIYAKQIQDMTSDSAAGPGWIKLWEEGYDDSTGKWCTEKLIDNNGLMSIDIPKSLPGGYWLFRPELLALQNVQANDPQFYTGCAQVLVQSDNTAAVNVPAEYSVSIPGHVQAGEPALTFDIYSPNFPYPMPGPKVYTFAGSETKAQMSSASSKTVTQSKGQIPSDYLIKNANWVGVEVASYTTEDGCWKASEACFNQVENCYNTAPPTGSANCRVFEEKCDGISAACDAGDFNGPPNKGEKLQDQEPEPPSNLPAPGETKKRRTRRARAMTSWLFRNRG